MHIRYTRNRLVQEKAPGKFILHLLATTVKCDTILKRIKMITRTGKEENLCALRKIDDNERF
jgi:hypothetical protein